jgi:hypothetical protein
MHESVLAYHEARAAHSGPDQLNDRTWSDLDFSAVFTAIDRTASLPGRQYLYHRLRTPRFDGSTLDQFEQLVQRHRSDAARAEKSRTELARLDTARAGHLVALLDGVLPPRPLLWWLFPCLTLAALASLALIAVWPRALFALIAIFAINIVVQLIYRPRVRRFVPAVHALPTFVDVAAKLGALWSGVPGREATVLREGASKLRSVRAATLWLMAEPPPTHDLLGSLYEFANMLFLMDVTAFAFVRDRLQHLQPTLNDMFVGLGELDLAQSVATWRATLPHWTTPRFMEARKELRVGGLYHPLVDRPVANSLHVEATGVLITGSNMSGKTTFLRAAGVSAVLAQALNTACAADWSAPFVRVRTLIGRQDDLLTGKSYYMAELEAMRSHVMSVGGDRPHLFLLDEIFRGTNTVERVAAAFAVLTHLNRDGDIVMVATHDLELRDRLGASFAPYYFEEQVTDGGLGFDYTLRHGLSGSRNAIALLGLMGYPEAIINQARAAAIG